MSDTLDIITDRIGKKSASISSDETKMTTLKNQIAVYQSSHDRLQSGVELKRSEVEELITLRIRAEILTKERDRLLAYTEGLRLKFDAIEWVPDLSWEQTLESTDYAEKIADRQRINAELVEIEKAANKIYFRR